MKNSPRLKSLNTQIRDIKVNLVSHKLQTKHETDNIKNTLDDVEKGQDLISQKSEEHNIKISKLMQDNKKLPMENSELNNRINNLIEQQESRKCKPTNQGGALDHHG